VPAREGEPAGEQAALVVFGAARLASAPQVWRCSMFIKTALAQLLTVEVAATAATAVADLLG
jgi:hypothetical protein